MVLLVAVHRTDKCAPYILVLLIALESKLYYKLFIKN